MAGLLGHMSKMSLNDNEDYEFNNRRGLAVIIVNESFLHKNKRSGARKDIEMTTKTFAGLGFEVRSYFDQTTTQMLSRIKTALAEKEEIQKVDCFALVISSHGYPDLERTKTGLAKTDWIWGVDKDIKIDTLLQPLTIAECPELADKPKLVFIQACRGGRASNVTYVEEGRVEGVPPVIPQRLTDEAVSLNIPLQKNFLLAWACQPEFTAFSRPSGSWFIKGLCHILDWYVKKGQDLLDNHKKEKKEKMKTPLEKYMHENLEAFDLVELMTRVNQYVGEGKKFISDIRVPDDEYLHNSKAMPWIAHQLIKNLHLYKMFIPK